MKHLEIRCYLHVHLVNLIVKNKTTHKTLVESSVQEGEGKEKDEGRKAATDERSKGGLWGLSHCFV